MRFLRVPYHSARWTLSITAASSWVQVGGAITGPRLKAATSLASEVVPSGIWVSCAVTPSTVNTVEVVYQRRPPPLHGLLMTVFLTTKKGNALVLCQNPSGWVVTYCFMLSIWFNPTAPLPVPSHPNRLLCTSVLLGDCICLR